MSLVHKLKKFVDNGLEKFPMRLEEAWVLAHNIHDVTGYNSLVVFSAFHLSKAQEIFNHTNEESFFGLFVHGP